MILNLWNRTLASLAVTVLVSVTAFAQEATSAMTKTSTAEESSSVSTASAGGAATDGRFDTRETREHFLALLERHPHEVAVVLKYDPSLFRNEAYMANYPEIAAFVKRHPEVAQNPASFLDADWIPARMSIGRPTSAERATERLYETISIVSVFSVVTFALIWLIRTLLAHRRWSRASKVQTELHNKLIDRITSHEDLLRYVESGAGKQFLESAITPLSAGTVPEAAAPLSRILWSVQMGVVMLAIGIGLQVVGARATPDISNTISGLGVIGICAGLGLILSAVVSYILSRKLGLMKPVVDAAE